MSFFASFQVFLLSGNGFLMLTSLLEDTVLQKLKGLMLPALFVPSQEPLFEERAGLLSMVKRLGWKYITLIVDQQSISQPFNEAAEDADVCVVENILINTNK